MASQNDKLPNNYAIVLIIHMKNKLITIIIIALFLFLAPIVKAENQAGSSAQLSIASQFDNQELDEAILRKKEMAIKAVLERYNSPMVGEEKSFIKTCRQYHLDCYLLPSIAGLESTFGRFIYPNSYNPFGWARGYMIFQSWSEGIDTVGKGLRENYINKWGLLTVDEIGPIYSESPSWAARVNWFINQFVLEEEKLSLLSSEFPVKL